MAKVQSTKNQNSKKIKTLENIKLELTRRTEELMRKIENLHKEAMKKLSFTIQSLVSVLQHDKFLVQKLRISKKSNPQ